MLERTGITARYADACNWEALAGQINERTRLLYVESPAIPLLRVVDIRRIADMAHANGALPTKYLCGHSDVTGGVVVVKDEELATQIYFLQNAEGNALGPFDAFPCLRGLKTLKLRLDCQQKNAGRRGISGSAPASHLGQLSGARYFSGILVAAQTGARGGRSAELHHRVAGVVAENRGGGAHVQYLCQLRQHQFDH